MSPTGHSQKGQRCFVRNVASQTFQILKTWKVRIPAPYNEELKGS